MRHRTLIAAAAVLTLSGATALTLWPRPAPPAAARCAAQGVGERLGTDVLLWGGMFEDAAFAERPYTLRYRYLAGPVPKERCTSCLDCHIDGVSCENPDGCGWWGCWQDDALPPGQIATAFVRDNPVPTLLTWYTWLSISGGREGEAEVKALADPLKVEPWLDDLRRLAQLVDGYGPVILHLEPDLLGFVHQYSSQPSQVPVAVQVAPECAQMSPTAASIVPCWTQIIRQHAPQALVAIHVSAWGAGVDLMRERRRINVGQHAGRTVDFLRAASVQADLLVVEASDRDAGFDGDPWRDDQPSLHRALQWAGALTSALDTPHLWWQVPMGTPELANTCGQYTDDRVLRFVAARQAVAQAGGLGVAFGAGEDCMTSASTDSGAFSRAIAPAIADPTPLCGQ